tara:strand:- start:99 stop:272 length:174 start_codon:yes stop_codon:yes gene_type:complete
MPKIPNITLPSAGEEYNPEHFNQIISAIELITQRLNSNFTNSVAEDTEDAQIWFLGG